MHVGAHQLKLLSNKSGIVKAGLQPAPHSPELAATPRNSSSTNCHIHFAEDAVAVLRQQVQGHEPRLCEVEPVYATAESAGATADCNFLSLAVRVTFR